VVRLRRLLGNFAPNVAQLSTSSNELCTGDADRDLDARIEVVCRRLETRDQTFHRWPHLCGGMKEPEMPGGEINFSKGWDSSSSIACGRSE
jgi:hypothetical protein